MLVAEDKQQICSRVGKTCSTSAIPVPH